MCNLIRQLGTLSSIWIDRLITWLKWPTAILALSFLPGALIAMIELLVRVVTRPLPVTMFLVGFVGCTVCPSRGVRASFA